MVCVQSVSLRQVKHTRPSLRLPAHILTQLEVSRLRRLRRAAAVIVLEPDVHVSAANPPVRSSGVALQSYECSGTPELSGAQLPLLSAAKELNEIIRDEELCANTHVDKSSKPIPCAIRIESPW